eukprot:gene21046-27272_t
MNAYFSLVAYLLPDLFVIISPIAFALATLFCFHKLMITHELAALRSLGISNLRLSLPVLSLASGLLVCLMFLNIIIVPASFQKLKQQEHIMRNAFSGALLKGGSFNTSKVFTLYIREYNDEDEMHGIFIYQPAKDGNPAHTILADSGRVFKTNDRLLLLLKKGQRQDYDTVNRQYAYFSFDEFVYDLTDTISSSESRTERASEKSIHQLLNPEKSVLDDMKFRFRAEAHQRILLPFLSLLDALWISGVLLSGELGRRYNRKKTVVAAAGVLLTHLITMGMLHGSVRIASLLWLAYVFIALGIAVGFCHPDASLGLVLELTLLVLPQRFIELLPFIVFLASLLSLWRLNQLNEITAIRSLGISGGQLALGLCVTTILVGAISLLVLNPIAAHLNARHNTIEERSLKYNHQRLSISHTGFWLKTIENEQKTIFHSDSFSLHDRTFKNVTFYEFDINNQFKHRIDATEATLLDGKWLLKNVQTWQENKVLVVDKEQYRPTDLTLEKIQQSTIQPNQLPFWLIPAFIRQQQQNGMSTLLYDVYWHRLWAELALLGVMSVLAVGFCLPNSRYHATGRLIGLALISGFVIHFFNNIIHAYGLADRLSAFWAAWLPPIVTGFLGVATLSVANDIPVDLKADLVVYDALAESVTATGHVTLTQKTHSGTRLLKAHRVIYDSKNLSIVAYGSDDEKIEYHDIDGNRIYAVELTLSQDFKTGSIKTFTMLTNEKATIHAAHGLREDGIVSTMEDADYTPCTFCSTRKPMWQLKAKKVVHNKEKQQIEYTNAYFEIKGVPVFYTPYFSHPDPTVKRKSGILSPIYGHNNDLGYVVGLPVFYAISDQKDMTITPVMTTKQSGIIQTEYRQRFRDGIFSILGSYTRTQDLPPAPLPSQLQPNGPRPPKPDRWNLSMQSNVDINDNQRVKVDINRASDTTYLQRYSIVRESPFIQNNQNLRSNVSWQHFSNNAYVDIQSYAFQTDAPKTTPIILPKGTYHYQTETPTIGGTTAIEGGVLALFRHQPVPGRSGTEMYRLSNGLTWKRPWLLPYGQIVTLQGQARADVYMMRRYFETAVDANVASSKLEHRHVRFFPVGNIDWQWPFQKRMDLANWIIKPQAMIVSSPLNVNNRHIPNEDSMTFELDDTSLFLPNRFDGVDRVDTGTRAIAGVENEMRFTKQRSVSLFLGQSRRLDNQHVVRSGLGEDNATSDMLMRLKAKPASWFSSRYRMAINPNFNVVRYSELGASVGKPVFKVDAAYVFLNRRATLENWKVSVGQIRNLKRREGGASLETYASTTYDDECFSVDFGIYRSGIADRDIKPDTTFLLTLNFKTLAGIAISPAPKYQANMLTSGVSFFKRMLKQ